MTQKEIKAQTARIREKYSCYKVADIAVSLFLHDVPAEDVAYIMQGGEAVKMTPYAALWAWLAGAMDRMEERVPNAVSLRQESACCLGGARETLTRKICKENATVEERFAALSKERTIIGGKAWQENDDYYITYWYAKPSDGYTCACVKYVPETPMNKLWCECCAGHIKHHFEIALGVKATCTCVTSVLSSCGEDACLFKLNIVEKDGAEA